MHTNTFKTKILKKRVGSVKRERSRDTFYVYQFLADIIDK